MRRLLRRVICRRFGHWWKVWDVTHLGSTDREYRKVCRVCGVWSNTHHFVVESGGVRYIGVNKP